jgi:hypothetical protein
LWPFSFGDFVLLKPEELNAYASAVVRVARKHADGLGCVLEQDVLSAGIDFEDLKRIPDAAAARSLLHAVVELFIERGVALREREYIVFPSKFNRKLPDIPEPRQSDIIYSFAGAIEDIYATLAVRLFYSDAFKLKDLWKNAAEFLCPSGKICGFQLKDPKEGRGQISVFFDKLTAIESKILFLEFIHEHLKRFAISGSVIRERIYHCPECSEIMQRRAVEKRLNDKKKSIICQYCDEKTHLIELLRLEEKFGDEELLRRVRKIEQEVEEKKEQQVGVTTIKAKVEIGEFDVFLCHNNKDKSDVKAIGEKLKEKGILPWLDEWELRPGVPWQQVLEEQIEQIKSAAVFIGEEGIGPWQQMELAAFLREFVSRSCPVIPVLLPNAPKKPKLPVFLTGMTWVDFRNFVPDPLDQLVWGITGKQPERDIRK